MAEAVKEVRNSPKASYFKERADRLSKTTIDTVEAPLGATTKYFWDNVTGKWIFLDNVVNREVEAWVPYPCHHMCTGRDKRISVARLR